MKNNSRLKIGRNSFLYALPVFLFIVLLPVMAHFNIEKHMDELMGRSAAGILFWSLFIVSFLLPFFGWYINSKRRREYIEEILNNGESGSAVIRSIRQTGTKITSGADEKWGVNFELDVKTVSGETFQANAEFFVSVLQIPQYQPGSIVQVKYDPYDKTVVVIYGLS